MTVAVYAFLAGALPGAIIGAVLTATWIDATHLDDLERWRRRGGHR